MKNARKMYTSQASLCAFGIYLRHHHLLDNLQDVAIPQKKSTMRHGKNCSMHSCSLWPEERP